MHSDEIMQYLEPAHGLVFGSSILHWEYYYGGRSWLVPGAIAAILFLCKLLGLGEPAYYIPAVKLTLCAFSLLIPLCLYHLGRRLFGETSGRIALLLGVFWYELIGFAHKPMTEFIATSLFLALLTFVLRPQRLTPAQAASASAFAVFIVAVRLQYAPLLALLWLLPFWQGNARTRLMMLAAAAAAVGAVGLFDKLTWGGFLQSYYINYHYNAALDVHRNTPGHYGLWLLVASGGLIVPVLAAALGNRQRLFVLLLMLAIFISHEMQVHREYRFLFVLIPLWLLLCADVLANGWRGQRAKSAVTKEGWRQRGGITLWLALVSIAGIANALPGQALLYETETKNNRYGHFAHFLRQQDERFDLYRRLAADSSVRGVMDSSNSYHTSGGYYMLHRKVPFYDNSVFIPHTRVKRFVSHLITAPLSVVRGLRTRSSGERVLVTAEGGVFQLPVYIGDATLKRLVYWSKDGHSSVVKGFTLVSAGKQFTLWKAKPSAPVLTWTDYRIYLKNERKHNILVQAFGSVSKPPLSSHSFEFAEAPAAQ